MRLQTKLVLLITLVAASIGLLSSLLVSRAMHAAMETELQGTAVIVAQTLAEHVTHYVIDDDAISAREGLLQIVRRTEDVQYAFIVGFDGEVFAHSFEGGIPRAMVHETYAMALCDTHGSHMVHLERYLTSEGPILDVGYSLIPRMDAHLHIGMSESRLMAQVAALRHRILGLTFATVLLCIVLGTAVSRRITRPLSKVADSMQAFGRGMSEEEIPFRGGGRELADLTRAFNQMIGEHKQADEALRESQQTYKTLVEHLPQKIFLKDRNSTYLSCNENFARDLGITPEQFAGKTDYDFFPKELAEKYIADDKRILKSGEVENLEEKYIQDGQEVFVYTVKTPFKDDEGNVIGILGIFWDITERKQAEEELEKHRAHLEEMVRDRTAELEKRVSEVQQLNDAMMNISEDLRITNANLESTTRQLVAANSELEAFSYSVSHDLRAPLRAIDGFSNALFEDYYNTLDDEGKRLLNVIRDEAQRMGCLIGDLLSFSRMGRKEMRQSAIDMGELAKSVLKELKANAAERNLQFIVNTLPSAYGDSAMIRQVFVNLLSNAIKFTKTRDVAAIEVVGKVEENEYIYFVRDNGIGFDMKYVKKLFGVFQRLHSEDEFAGTGVGLAIAQRIINRHGGRVWAEGKVNEGAAFYFTLPKQGGGHEQDK